MFWLKNEENSFPIHTFIWRPGEYPDEMSCNAAFHQGLHCLQLCQGKISLHSIFLVIITWDPSIYTMDHPKFIV